MLNDARFEPGASAFIAAWAGFSPSDAIAARTAYPTLDAPRFIRAAKIELQDFAVREIAARAILRRLLASAEFELREP